MRRTSLLVALLFFAAVSLAPAQEKRSWLNRLFHPFGTSQKLPEYKDRKLRGLLLAVELPEGAVRLSETRQLPVHVTLTNKGDRAVELGFPSAQRIEILLHDSVGQIVTRWSENRAFEDQPGNLLINPNEYVEYSETIATRELDPGRVFTVEVMIPAYPELDVQRKSITAP